MIFIILVQHKTRGNFERLLEDPRAEEEAVLWVEQFPDDIVMEFIPGAICPDDLSSLEINDG